MGCQSAQRLHFPRQIVFGEVDVTQGGRVDRNIFDDLVVAMLD